MPKQAEVASKKQYKFLLSVVKATNYAVRDTLLIYFSYGLGLRACELAGLNLNQVINDKGEVIERVLLTVTKGDEDNETYLTDPDIKKALLEYVEWLKAHCQKKRKPFSLNLPLFISQKGGRFSNKTMQKCFDRIYKQAFMKGFSSHSGRRTLASRLDEMGYSMRDIQAILRHKDIKTTARYIQTNPLRLQKVMAKALYK